MRYYKLKYDCQRSVKKMTEAINIELKNYLKIKAIIDYVK